MPSSGAIFVVVGILLAGSYYLRLLARRLRGPHPGSLAQRSLSVEELNAVSYDDIDILACLDKEPTGRKYLVVGGSGFVGSYIVRLLLKRGERDVQILDRVAPPEDLAAVSFSAVDITSERAVHAAFAGIAPDIVIHTAALIRFWERWAYTFSPTRRVNVLGTSFLLAAAAEAGAKVFIYCSSGDVAIPRPSFSRLAYGRIVIRDADGPLPQHEFSQSCYSRSKLMAEELVIAADRPGGMRTGVLRPGFTILGPNDRLITSTLTLPEVPVFDEQFSQTSVHVWDVAAAHVKYADRLVSGTDDERNQLSAQRFLVTCKGGGWRLYDVRRAIQHYAQRPIILRPVPPLAIFIISHLVELLLWIRYRVLSLFTSSPSLVPGWIGQVAFLQPATLEYLTDVEIDDSRARRVLGYEPQWTMAQSIRYAVDEVCSGQATFGQHTGLAMQEGKGHMLEA
ncbi:NAD(P)-binding protein [Auricularia subglabra TFB-10046 SS5]|uniref:NAD(P)-binding protein n=1 Tax=Auricularia subglabra (strain TFB-10046 / SS5) TaxID=717982 RepID=J0CWE0_AURST|nr:NAD(P)-binding protein [Auricularia subglabra TFB-10046 SS5]